MVREQNSCPELVSLMSWSFVSIAFALVRLHLEPLKGKRETVHNGEGTAADSTLKVTAADSSLKVEHPMSRSRSTS